MENCNVLPEHRCFLSLTHEQFLPLVNWCELCPLDPGLIEVREPQALNFFFLWTGGGKSQLSFRGSEDAAPCIRKRICRDRLIEQNLLRATRTKAERAGLIVPTQRR